MSRYEFAAAFRCAEAGFVVMKAGTESGMAFRTADVLCIGGAPTFLSAVSAICSHSSSEVWDLYVWELPIVANV